MNYVSGDAHGRGMGRIWRCKVSLLLVWNYDKNAYALSLPNLQSPIYGKCTIGGRPKFDHRNYPALSRRSELPKSYGCNHLITSQETIMSGRI